MKFNKICMCLRPFLNGLSLFLGVLFLGLMSCSSATVSSPSSPKEDKTPPNVAISTNENLEINITGTITFAFSENVTNFTPDDIQFLSNKANGVNNVEKGKFVTNNQKSYSLQITPKEEGTLYVSIPTNSFYDLYSNQNTDSFSNNFLVKEDKTPPNVTISTNENLAINKTGTITFTFSEKVTNFTSDDIQFLPTSFSLEKVKFVTNNQKSYSLQITPKEEGTLYVSIPTNSFYDLYSNQNDKPYSSGFAIFPPGATIHTISFKLNGGSFIFPQITNLKVVSNTAIEKTKLGRILSYPPTGPKPSINAVTRDIFEWRTNDGGTKYDFSTLVSSDLTLEAVWSNSCGKTETFHPANRNELKTYTDAAVSNSTTTNLNHIDTSAITDMTELFKDKNTFNGEIGCWNTAKVNNMNSMFSGATAFNQDISRWDVANVTTMNSMFAIAGAFNQDISTWNVANVTTMNSMFAIAGAFNQDISTWNVANVTSMRGMFNSAWSFNQDISKWDVANVTSMRGMFQATSLFNQDIGRWNVSNVTDMSSMFENAVSFNQDISKWSVDNVTKYDNMFTGSAMESKTNQHPTFP